MRAVFPTLLLSTMLVGCGSPFMSARQQAKNWFAALDAARPSAPYVSEFVRLFPGTQVRYRYFTSTGEPGFDLSADLHERYELILQLPVIFDASGKKVVGYGEPNFYLREVTQVERAANGNAVESYSPSGGGHFGRSEWQKIVESGGDFGVIGYTIVTNRPVDGFKGRMNPLRP